MCVIICRDPGIVVPPEKIESAALVNPDGYGISVIDRGKLETIKEATPNKATTIIKRLEDAKDQKVFLHLRFRTHGEINVENCHPYEVYTDNENVIQMMHNGVLHDFSSGYNAKMSDTYNFNETILKPLVRKLIPWHTENNESVLEDETLKLVIEKYCGTGSKIVLYDNQDNFMIANRKGGVEYEGWWASNDYSFNRTHRTSTYNSNTYKGGYYGGGRSHGAYSWQDDNCEWEPDTTSTASTSSKTNQASTTKAGKEAAKDKEVAKTAKGVGTMVRTAETTAKHVNPTIVPPSMRDTFIELTGITSLTQLTMLEREDIFEIVQEYPEAATVLIMDLLFDLYQKDKNQYAKETSIGSV